MINELFHENPNEVEEIPIQDGELRLYPHSFSPEERKAFFTRLKQKVKWQQEEIKLYGRSIPLSRLTAWFGKEIFKFRKPRKIYLDGRAEKALIVKLEKAN